MHACRYAPSALELCQAKAVSYPFFAANTGIIEIVRLDKTLELVYFPVRCTTLAAALALPASG